MTQEDKNLLLKDLCARLPYRVKVSIKNINSDNAPWHGILSCKDLDCFIHDVAYEYIKPYLRSMDSMTKEECKYFQTCAFPYDFVDALNKHHFDYRRLISKGLALEALEGMYK